MSLVSPPAPIEIDLSGGEGFQFRAAAWEYLQAHPNLTGAERGSSDQQLLGLLAERLVRRELGQPLEPTPGQAAGHDVLLPSGVRMDVKCRGGERPFRLTYDSPDGVPREAKHNLFARQVYNPSLETDVYLFVHLQTPKRSKGPGTARQRNWRAFVCGWASKLRVARDGVYLPRGSLTERGGSWFTYRGQEVEFYHHSLVALPSVASLNQLTPTDVGADQQCRLGLNLTRADATRIVSDLVGRGLLAAGDAEAFRGSLAVAGNVGPILHANQYHHLVEWLVAEGRLSSDAPARLGRQMSKVPFSGV